MDDDEKNYAKVIEKFDDHFAPKKNIIHERACFHRRFQKEEKSLEARIRNLYELAEHCEFETQWDEETRDRITIGNLHKSLSQNLWMKSDLNRKIAIQMTRQSELVKLQVAGQSDDKHLGEVHQRKGKPNPTRKPIRNWYDRNLKNNPPGVPCTLLNRLHKQEDVCPAKGKNLLQMSKSW